MKKKCLLLTIILVAIFSFSNAYSATFSIIVDESVSLIDIDAFQFKFKVSEDFGYSDLSLSDALPTGGTFGWYSSQSLNEGVLSLTGGDYDYMMLGSTDYEMTSGTILNFEYTGDILDIIETAIQFGAHGGKNQWDDLKTNDNVSYTLTNESLTFSSVPVPSAFLLLLTGLCSLAGLTRKKQ